MPAMKRIAAVLLAVLAAPALAQAPSQVERVETPEGAVTVIRPPPRAQQATPPPMVNPDPVPPPPATPFPTDADIRNAPPYPGADPVVYPAPYYVPYVVVNPPAVMIQRRPVPPQALRRFDDVGPVPPFESPPGRFAPRLQPGPQPRSYGPGTIPGAPPPADAGGVVILRR